jgi:hypothetical protein
MKDLKSYATEMADNMTAKSGQVDYHQLRFWVNFYAATHTEANRVLESIRNTYECSNWNTCYEKATDSGLAV